MQTFHKHVVILTAWLWTQCLCGGQKPNIYAEKVGGWGRAAIKQSMHQNQIVGLWTVYNENVNFRVINNELVGYYR